MSLYQQICDQLNAIQKRDHDLPLDPHEIANLKAKFELFISRMADKRDVHMEELVKEQEHARDIIENSKIVVFEWTIEPDIPTKYVSRNISQFGYTPEDFYSGELKDYWEFVHPGDREIAKKNIYTARSLPIEEFRHSYRILTKDGQVRWIEERIIFDRDPAGVLLHEKGILLDITDIKDLEFRLKQSKERYEKLFENAAAMIFTISPDGGITAANRKFLTAFDLRRGDLKRLKIFALMSESYREQFRHMDLVKFAEAYRTKSFDLEMQKKSGDIFTFSASASVLEAGEATCEIEFIAFDVTEKKRAEREIAFLSYHDKLTGCFNRAFFDEELIRIDSLQEYPYTLIVGDMNGLKEVNDLLGHRAGDQLLVRMAEIIKQSCREKDIVARFGGDEFAILCPHASEEVAKAVMARIQQNCEKESSYVIKPSIAMGFATKKDVHGSTDELFKEADHAMYDNKAAQNNNRRNSLVSSVHHTLEGHTMETRAHIQAIQYVSKLIGDIMELQPNELEELNLAAMLHDIGKVFVPDDLLLKVEPLTEKEKEILRNHSEMGYQMLSTSNITSSIAEHVLCHHERWDGEGYPRGLKGASIPLITRVVSISDAFVSMMESRPYRAAKSCEVAFEELKANAAKQFDPDIIALMARHEALFHDVLMQSYEVV